MGNLTISSVRCLECDAESHIEVLWNMKVFRAMGRKDARMEMTERARGESEGRRPNEKKFSERGEQPDEPDSWRKTTTRQLKILQNCKVVVESSVENCEGR
ncbi:hypothetical protein EDB85DRAFT_1895412 [Lactarius pseudohatsudake]|nr:hypothetical protein EDB85DRAFT_1895412 [Lactarius pseudohatsudake]